MKIDKYEPTVCKGTGVICQGKGLVAMFIHNSSVLVKVVRNVELFNRRLFCQMYFFLHFAFFCFQIFSKLTGYVELSIFRQIYAMNTLRFSNFVIIAE